jgi:peptidoglycan/LPS O-acetylase OafA/YrhL
MTPKRYLEIERLRAIAVIWVILHHSVAFSPYVNQLFKQGWTGVDLFFVISGFVVAKSFDSKLPTQDSSSNLMDKLKFYGPHLKTFWGRRIMRIVPLALGWILISSALWQWVPDWQAFAPYEKGYSREIISFLTLQINFINLHQASKFFHYWSLAVEEHFYLLLPFLFVSTRNRSYPCLRCSNKPRISGQFLLSKSYFSLDRKKVLWTLRHSYARPVASHFPKHSPAILANTFPLVFSGRLECSCLSHSAF